MMQYKQGIPYIVSMRIIVLLIIVMASCSPSAKLRRAEKLIRKAEDLGAQWRIDSVFVEVPVFVPETRVDSVFVQKAGDTVTIEKERLKVKIMRLPGDTIKVEAECEADTIRIKQVVTVNKTIEAKGGLRWWWLLVAAAAGMILGAIVRLVR